MKRLPVILIMAALLAGCAANGLLHKPWADYSPKEKAIYFNGVYNGEVKAYKADMERWKLMLPGERRDALQSVLKAKYAVFTEIHPLLLAYTRYAETGVVPVADIEQNILRLIGKMGGVL